MEGTFDNPISTEGLTPEQCCNLIDAGVILDLRSDDDKAADVTSFWTEEG